MTKTNTEKSVEEIVEEFTQRYVDIQKNIKGDEAYREWRYEDDAEDATKWLLTTLQTERQKREEAVEKAEQTPFRSMQMSYDSGFADGVNKALKNKWKDGSELTHTNNPK